jgi:hypothetical protein
MYLSFILLDELKRLRLKQHLEMQNLSLQLCKYSLDTSIELANFTDFTVPKNARSILEHFFPPKGNP